MADFVGIFWANVCTDLTNSEKKYSNFAYSTTASKETLTTLNFQVQHNRFDWGHGSTDQSRKVDYDGFHRNGLYGKILTKKEPIKMFQFTGFWRLPCCM